MLAAADKAGVPVAVPRPGEDIEPADPPKVACWRPEAPWRTTGEAPIISSGLGQPHLTDLELVTETERWVEGGSVR